MAYTGQGNRQPEIDAIEHDPVALAKRSEIVALNNAGTAYIGPTIFDYVNSNPLGVVLVDTNGDAYVASGGGGGPAANVSAYISGTISLPVYVFTSTTLNAVVAGNVTSFVAASVTLFDVVGGTVTANIGLGTVTANVAGNVTGFIASSVTLNSVVGGTVTANIGLGTVTANIGLGTVTASIALGTITANCAAHNVTAFIAASVTLNAVVGGTVTANIGLGTVTANVVGTVTANIGLGTVTASIALGTVTANCAAHNVTAFIAASVTLNAVVGSHNVTAYVPGYQRLSYTTTNYLVTLSTGGPVLVSATNLTRASIMIGIRTTGAGSPQLAFIGGESNASGNGYIGVFNLFPYIDGGESVFQGGLNGTTTLNNTVVHVWERMWSS